MEVLVTVLHISWAYQILASKTADNINQVPRIILIEAQITEV